MHQKMGVLAFMPQRLVALLGDGSERYYTGEPLLGTRKNATQNHSLPRHFDKNVGSDAL